MPKQDAPLIGQFKGPAENSPRLPRKDSPPVQSKEDKAIEESMAIVDKEILQPMLKEGTPEQIAESYEEGLKSVDLTLSQARMIMEKILVDNYYEETMYIQSLPVTFRTRSYNDTVRLHQFLTAESPTYQASVQDLIARHNLAASLAKFGDREFRFPDDYKESAAAFEERMEFVKSRVEFTVTRLMELVYKFDNKLAKVFANGAPQDF
jgi:hypothetical protein